MTTWYMNITLSTARYRSNDMWDDALRVAKFHGGQSAHKRVAYAWALALGGDAGAKLLNKQVSGVRTAAWVRVSFNSGPSRQVRLGLVRFGKGGE